MKIIIVGGGIAGLSAAHALRSDENEITILEASSFSREIGASISLQPNATTIIHKWGIEPELRNRGAMIDGGFHIMGIDGSTQMKVPFVNQGAPRVLMHRVDLHEALKAAATSTDHPGKPATIKTSSRVVDADPKKGTVTLENGEVLEADMIIGCDGIRSKLREIVVGPEHQSKPTGLSAYRLMIPSEQVKDLFPSEMAKDIYAPQPWTTLVIGHDKRIIFGPCRSGTLMSFVALVPDEKMNESSEKSSWTSPGDKESMLESYKDYPEWARKVLGVADSGSLGLWQLRDIDSLPNWHKGKIMLIGDAAHAMLPTQGQGASQSLEDAEALGAFCKNIQPNEVEAAFERFFKCRYDRATLIQAYSRQQARPGTEAGSVKVNLNPMQFNKYNTQYEGALAWEKSQAETANAP